MMNPGDELLYTALRARDSRFDGMFFVGVSTTGIYCRPVCPARTPQRPRCTFHFSAAAAELAGFRPCLRCRPELAPGRAPVDAVHRLAHAAAARIDDGALDELSLDQLASELGVSARHLRRATESALGVAPVELAQTHRLLLAKRLLTDTALPVIEVALASGFKSLRRFNALFRERYRLTPSALRRVRPDGAAAGGAILRCDLAYRPPFAWPELLSFLATRSVTGVEAIADGCYRRTVSHGRHRGWLSVSPAPGGRAVLRVQLSASLAPAVSPVLARVKRLFDLSAAPELIAAQLGPLARGHPGLRVPGAFDGFEIGIRAILGQQVTVAGATTLARRFGRAFGEPIATPYADLDRLTPGAVCVARAEVGDIAKLGIIRSRAAAIIALARAVASGDLVLAPGADPQVVIAKLCALPGIGDWTAQYIAMRALGWPDAFPDTDLALRKAAGGISAAALRVQAEAWRPWRAYAVMQLWHRLSFPPTDPK